MTAAPGARPVLDASALVAGYQRDVHILRGVSVRAWAGRIACVLGPNGTGKSTLLKAILASSGRSRARCSTGTTTSPGWRRTT